MPTGVRIPFPALFFYTMTVTITPLGGVGEVGRNCFAVDVDGEIVLLDMGFHLERYIAVTEQDFPHKKHLLRRLLNQKAIPDARWIARRKQHIKGIILSHAHLDHVGAVPFLLNKANCPVYATPFTGNLVRSLCEVTKVEPDIRVHHAGETFSVGSFQVEFIHVAHSTPESVAIAIHTKNDGIVLYALDYKNDQSPPFQSVTNTQRFKELQGTVSFVILDMLYAHTPGYCPSELHARKELLALKDRLAKKRAILLSTFSSHLNRIRTFLDLANELGREPVFIGRSLAKYLSAGQHLLPESQAHTQLKFRQQIQRYLSKMTQPENYVFIVTGHQGELGAVLHRMADGEFNFTPDDVVVFSCKTIPTPLTQEHRRKLEATLSSKQVELIMDVHVSGHGYAQDQREFLSWTKPRFVLCAHTPQERIPVAQKLVTDSGSQPISLRLLESFQFSL